MPENPNNQNYFSSFGNKIVAVTIGGFVCPVEPYTMDEDELREINDD